MRRMIAVLALIPLAGCSQIAQLQRHRRLGDMQLFRRPGDGKQAGRGLERPQLLVGGTQGGLSVHSNLSMNAIRY